MKLNHLEVLKVLSKFSPIAALEILRFMPNGAGSMVITMELGELREQGFVKVWDAALHNPHGYLSFPVPSQLVSTWTGRVQAKPHEQYWEITEAGQEALKAELPPEPVKPKYLGEVPVIVETDPTYKNYEAAHWALEWIAMYGGIDGSHHKTWVLAQVAKILTGTPVLIKLASWDNGLTEYRFNLGDESEEFKTWKRAYEGDVYPDGSTEYEFDEGIPP